jgi:hypothetical protein
VSGQDRGLAAAENQDDRRLGRARFVLRSATTSHLRFFILARCRLPACWPGVSRQARACACAAAARALA